MLKIFVGWDPKEIAAYHVCCHSILKRASGPVAIIPLVQSALRARGTYTRPIDTKAATEFSLTRFLVPHLSGYEGTSIFMDSDMLVKCDLVDFAERLMDHSASVWVCKHDYVPKNATKMDGQAQAAYPRKNWSSFMVFDNAAFQCGALSPEYVNNASPADLHRFKWTDDRYIGSLPLEYNYLAGEENQSERPPKIIHFTEGGPWMRDYQNVEHAEDWRNEYREILPPWSWYQNHWQPSGVAA